jgi:NTE family protein
MYTSIMPCALVLSAGGMFGAYQAGAWKALADSFRPDFVVGASAGALNAWAIAGGCSPAELCAFWTDRTSADIMHVRIPALPWRGIFDPAPVYRQVDQFYTRFQPRLPFGLTMVEVPRLRQIYVTGDSITPAHLRASCAIPFCYPPVRIGGKYYVDGGLLAVVPLWAAVAMGATSAVVINVLPMMPSRFLRATVGTFRALAAGAISENRGGRDPPGGASRFGSRRRFLEGRERAPLDRAGRARGGGDSGEAGPIVTPAQF